MRFSGDYRARFEDQEHMRWRPANSDLYVLSRLRLGLQLKPLSWLTFYGQAQDSRIFFPKRIAPLPPVQDALDLRMAYVELGDPKKFPLQLRAGRQEITYSEERLIGVSNWSNLGRTFNAVKLLVQAPHAGGMKLEAFAGSVVAAREAMWNRSIAGDNFHGAYAVFDKLLPQGTVEPYIFWRLSPNVTTETAPRGKLDHRSHGLRVTRKFGPGWYASSDTVFQIGNRGTDSVKAWAAYWRVRRLYPAASWKPTLTGDLNMATGDKNPRDGIFQTFDVLYPTPHDKYGLADQVGWKNIRHVSGAVELTPRKGITLQSKLHSWWLASAMDGLYSAQGNLLVRDPLGRSGKHAGEELDFQFLWTPAKTLVVGGGVGRIFAGEFLRKASPSSPYTFYFLSLTRTL